MKAVTLKNNLKKKFVNAFNSMRLRRYYNEKSRNGKTYIAIILDKIFFSIFVFVSFIFFFFFISESFLFSILISVQAFLLYNLVAYKISKSRMRKKTALVNQQVFLKKTLRDMLNQTPHDFLEYVINILENYGFTSIVKVDKKDIDIIGTIWDKKIGIKCIQYDSDYKVGVDIVRDFFVGLRKLELSEGVIITTSSFTQEANNLIVRLKKYVQIQLIDIEEFIEVMKKANLYPTETEIKKLILNEISDSRMDFKSYKEIVLSKGKIIKYIFLGIIMLIFGKFTPYTTYYNVAAIIIFLIAVVSMIILIINMFKINEEKQEDKVL
ncbi:restriction endonuclease [Proteiniborus sp.]|uniref:restriction endonuclease n=1 Tax=Proteiniborus sp. TaxID=2079015 RepID=UPI00331C0424